MSWYWIVLIVICYALLSTIICVVLSKVAKSLDDGIIVLIAMFWPLVIMLLPVIMLIILLYEIVDKCRYNKD